MDYKPDIEAEVTYLTVEAGGRGTPILATGYRGDFHFRGQSYVSVHEYVGVDSVHPGQTVMVHLKFLRPQVLHPILSVDDEFEVREGTHVVARGMVTKILELAKHAAGQAR
jgi:translation elongation factor EF-Tu-like GTPase